MATIKQISASYILLIILCSLVYTPTAFASGSVSVTRGDTKTVTVTTSGVSGCDADTNYPLTTPDDGWRSAWEGKTLSNGFSYTHAFYADGSGSPYYFTCTNGQTSDTTNLNYSACPGGTTWSGTACNFNITTSAGANGSITPSTTVAPGGSVTIAITPNSGYSVASLTVDGASVTAATTYTFSNVQAAHTIAATFSVTTVNVPIVTITAKNTSQGNGTGHASYSESNANFSWSATNSPTSCTVKKGATQVATGNIASYTIPAADLTTTDGSNITYTVTCANDGGTSAGVDAVFVVPPQVTSLGAACPSPGTSLNLTWSTGYPKAYVRINRGATNNQGLVCPPGTQVPPNGVCTDLLVNANAYSMSSTAGQNYSGEVYAADAEGNWGHASVFSNLTCAAVATNHKVTFNGNGATGGSMSDQTASSPTNLTANAFTRTGYTFGGWNTVQSGVNGTPYANSAQYSFAADITLYAQWTSSSAGVTTSVVADPLVYNVTNGASVSFTYTPTTSSGSTECLLQNWDKSQNLTSFQASSPIVYTVPSTTNSYGYYVLCRNTTVTTSTGVSQNIIVNTSAAVQAGCSAATNYNSSHCNVSAVSNGSKSGTCSSGYTVGSCSNAYTCTSGSWNLTGSNTCALPVAPAGGPPVISVYVPTDWTPWPTSDTTINLGDTVNFVVYVDEGEDNHSGVNSIITYWRDTSGVTRSKVSDANTAVTNAAAYSTGLTNFGAGPVYPSFKPLTTGTYKVWFYAQDNDGQSASTAGRSITINVMPLSPPSTTKSVSFVTPAPYCEAVANANTCTVDVPWTAANVSQVRVTNNYTTNSVTSDATSGSGTFLTQVIKSNSHLFTIVDTSDASVGDTIQAGWYCAPGLVQSTSSPFNCVTPVVTLTATPNTVNSGGSTSLTWSNNAAGSVTCTSLGGFETGGARNNVTGVSSGALSGDTNFGIDCYDDGAIRKSGTPLHWYGNVHVTVIAPTISLTASPSRLPSGGGSVTLSWDASEVKNSCTVKKNGSVLQSTAVADASHHISGSTIVNGITTQTNFSIDCTTLGNTTKTTTIIVNVGSGFNQF